MSFSEVSVDELSEFIFKQNNRNSKIVLQSDDFHTTKDLFSFCVDLLCKGLSLTIDIVENDQIDIQSISIEQFNKVAERMLLAGIKVNIQVLENVTKLQPVINVIEKVNHSHLSDYCLQIIGKDRIYNLIFDLIRI